MMLRALAPAVLTLALLGAGAAQAAPRCQGLSPGVNTLKGVLHEFTASKPAPGQPPTTFVLRLDRPLCDHGQAMPVSGAFAEALQDRMLELAFSGGEPRRWVGRRVLVSGSLLERTPRRPQMVLQVGSLAPLPMVAGDKT